MSELKDTKKQAYTRKVLDRPIEKANAKRRKLMADRMEQYWNIDGDMDTRPELAAVRESFREGATNLRVREDMERFIMTFKFKEREKELYAVFPIYQDGVTELKVLEHEREEFRKLKRWTEASVKRGSEPVSNLEFYRFMIGLMTKRIRKERTNERRRHKK